MTQRDASAEIHTDESARSFSYGKMINTLRADLSSQEKTFGIPWLIRGTDKDFYDVKIWGKEGEFVKARLQLSSLYYIAYGKGKGDEIKKTIEAGGSRVDNLHHPDIRTPSEQHYNLVPLHFGSSYVGGMGTYVASSTNITRSAVFNAIEKLRQYEEGSVHDDVAKACVMIARIVSEAIRFKAISEEIARAWHGNSGYDFDRLAQHMVTNWEDLSELAREMDIKIGEGTAKQGKYTELEPKWKKVLNPFGVNNVAGLPKVLGILMRPEENQNVARTGSAKPSSSRGGKGKAVAK